MGNTKNSKNTKNSTKKTTNNKPSTNTKEIKLKEEKIDVSTEIMNEIDKYLLSSFHYQLVLNQHLKQR